MKSLRNVRDEVLANQTNQYPTMMIMVAIQNVSRRDPFGLNYKLNYLYGDDANATSRTDSIGICSSTPARP